MTLQRPIKITVCADGFVSILRNTKDRRLGAAIACYSAETVPDALMMIQKVCILKACEHGKKTGTLVEPWAPNWPIGRDATVEDTHELTRIFKQVEDAREKGAK